MVSFRLTSDVNITNVKFSQFFQKLLNSNFFQILQEQRNEDKLRIQNAEHCFLARGARSTVQVQLGFLGQGRNFDPDKSSIALLVGASHAAPSKIIGGQNAYDGQFPHQVTLKRSSGSHYCGGSIIAPDKVMCAAHCKQSNDNWTAGAGSAVIAYQRQGTDFIFLKEDLELNRVRI